MIGQLWCSLADYYIRGGHFEKVSVRFTSVCVCVFVYMYMIICMCT